ncbi:MAG TPA: beta-ketoacyl-ACP synthase II [Dehalococcoidia bacterium]|nr:beta-ketoacyl-ACP synthase II [Dehalococcoidia bacterium]
MSEANKRRVVVTGVGAVTPLAVGAKQSWQALCQGKSGVGRITKFDPCGFKTQIAAEVKDFHPEDFLDKKKIRRTDPFIHYALVAARLALDDAGLIINDSNAYRVGAVVGSCAGGMSTYEKNLLVITEGRPNDVSPFFITAFIANMAAGEISIACGAKGPSKCVVSACATGSYNIGDAFRLIQYGEADAMIAGGSEAYILPTGIAGLNKMRAISQRNDEPEKASRPFDKNRDGFVLGEGAGIVILEELGSAMKRGARIYAELVGYGSNIDGFHVTEPDYNTQAKCIQLALDDAAMPANEVDYVNAHGTSTILNDIAETKAIKAVLGEHSRKVPVSSNKSMMGHLLGAAGAVEAIFTILAIRDSIIPPTINYDTPDPECDLDYVPNVARKTEVNTALSNSFGFGGFNATLVFKKFNQ